MSDYTFKSEVMLSGIYAECKEISKAKYNAMYDKHLPCKYDIATALDMEHFFYQYALDEYLEGNRINHASLERTLRLKNKILSIVNSGVSSFITLTFDDETLSRTSKDTRRQYVRKLLKSISNNYVANIDFGKENDREHYHCVISGYFKDLNWSYGFYNVQKIRLKEDDTNNTITSKKLAKYTSKLTNHAIKETTKKNYCIYSR